MFSNKVKRILMMVCLGIVLLTQFATTNVFAIDPPTQHNDGGGGGKTPGKGGGGPPPEHTIN